MQNNQTVWIVLASPAGTTLEVGKTIEKRAQKEGKTVRMVDLADRESAAGTDLRTALAPGDILFAGSPTYANHPLPLVTEFLSDLPDAAGLMAAVFTTYGMVTSGMTLYEMALILMEKNMRLLGGIKVPAAHSMLWHDENQPGKGRPGVDDKAEVERFAGRVLEKAAADASALSLEDLNYQRREVREKAAEAGLHVLKPMLLPMDVDEAACTQCGVCVENCPNGNITLDPKPVFGDTCILCFNCVRTCEEGAITNKALPFMGDEIRKRMDFYQEAAEARSFL